MNKGKEKAKAPGRGNSPAGTFWLEKGGCYDSYTKKKQQKRQQNVFKKSRMRNTNSNPKQFENNWNEEKKEKTSRKQEEKKRKHVKICMNYFLASYEQTAWRKPKQNISGHKIAMNNWTSTISGRL